MNEQDEKTILMLDHHFGSRQLTNFYKTTYKLKSNLINYSQYLALFKGQLHIQTSPRLLFRASRDGFSFSDFHSRCDNQLKLLIIVKSQEGDLFGGYTTKNINLPPKCTYDSVRDDDSFTFQFDEEKLYIFKLVPEQLENALHRYEKYYLFAFSLCFWISEDYNTKMSGSHYSTAKNLLPECRLPYGKQYFGGMSFRVEDMEVFKIEE